MSDPILNEGSMSTHPFRYEDLSIGGRVNFYRTPEGRVFSILGDDYAAEGVNDWEIHERRDDESEDYPVIPLTEQRAASLTEALALIGL